MYCESEEAHFANANVCSTTLSGGHCSGTTWKVDAIHRGRQGITMNSLLLPWLIIGPSFSNTQGFDTCYCYVMLYFDRRPTPMVIHVIATTDRIIWLPIILNDFVDSLLLCKPLWTIY